MTKAHDKRLALREMLAKPELVFAPSCGDPMTARLVESLGIPALHCSGSSLHREAGYPDAGVLTLTEMAASHARICAAVGIPVIGDADTGFGGLMNVVRTVQEYERAGVAAMHLEDQLTPKRPPTSGEVNDTITRREMVDKIRAAVDAREDQSLFIIARSEVHGDPDEVVARLQECVAAGADGAWISGHDAEDVRRLRAAIDAPLIGVLPRGMSLHEYGALGANCALLPTWLDTVATNAKRRFLSEMLAAGTAEGFLSGLEGLDGDRAFVQDQGQDELRRLEHNFS